MLDTLFFYHLFTEKLISAYQKEQDDAEGEDAVSDEEH